MTLLRARFAAGLTCVVACVVALVRVGTLAAQPPEARAKTPALACAEETRPVLLALEKDADLDRARLAAELELELGLQFVELDDEDCRARGTLAIVRTGQGRYLVRYTARDGEATQRAITARGAAAYASIALLAGNLVRNEAASLLAAEAPSPERTTTPAQQTTVTAGSTAQPGSTVHSFFADTPAPVPAPPDRSELDRVHEASIHVALLTGATPRLDGQRRAFVAPELAIRGTRPWFAGEIGLSLFEADYAGGDRVHVRYEVTGELHAPLFLPALSVFAQLGVSIVIAGRGASGFAARVSGGARYFVAEWFSVALEARSYGVFLGNWSAGGSSLPAGSFPVLGVIDFGVHYGGP